LDAVSCDILILEHCKGDFKPITSIASVIPGSTLYYRTNRLLRRGWLESDGKNRYRTTKEGELQLEELIGEAPLGLTTVYPPLSQVPTLLHRAAIELIIAAVIARQNNIRLDSHLFFIVAGPTMTWKSSLALFLCYTFGLDPASHIINVTAEVGKGLWVRRTATGAISYKRELLSAQLVIFDEYQNASTETKKLMRLWTDGRKNVPAENEQVTIEPVSVIILNPSHGKTLEERLGMDRTQIRRAGICLVDRVPDLVVKGEEALNAAKARGPLELPKPKTTDCSMYKAAMYKLFTLGLNSEGQELVNFESLAMLAVAMTAFMDLEEAIRLVFHDAFLLYGALGWTVPGWQRMVRQFPSTASRDESSIVSGDKPVPQDMLIQAFEHLKNGGSTIDLVTELGMTTEDADSAAQKFYRLRDIHEKNSNKNVRDQPEDNRVRELETDVKIAELMHKKEEYTKPLELGKEMEDLKACLEEKGNEKRSSCSHFIKDYCDKRVGMEKPNSPSAIGVPIAKGKRWYICPTSISCAACGNYINKESYSPQLIRANIQSIYQELGVIRQKQAEQGKLIDDTPDSGIRYRHTCSKCGAKGLVATKVVCTKCGNESQWGFHPKS